MEQISTDVAGAVKATGLGKTTIYEALRDGRLESVRIGRRRLILIRSLRRLIEGEA